jgi:hypothetical protein
VVIIAAAIVIAGPKTAVALGHGPCRCLDPRVAEAGSPVRVGFEVGVGETRGRGYPAYRVVFNPRPDDLGMAPRFLASAYRADVPTGTVLSRPRNRPTRRGRFLIPAATPPGLYAVLIFDGTEGGAHNTWEYQHVVEPGEAPTGVVARSSGPRAPDAASAPGNAWWPASVGSWLLLAIVAVASVAAGRFIGRREHSRRV